MKKMGLVALLVAMSLHAETPLTTASGVVYDIPRVAAKEPDALEWGEGVGFRVEALADPTIGVARADIVNARCRFGWNEEGLLVFVEVRGTAPQEGENVWGSDYVKVLAGRVAGAFELVQYMIAPRFESSKPIVEFWRYRREHVERNLPAPHRFAIRGTEGGYVVELLIPWSALEATPVPGLELEVQVIAADLDANKNRQYPRWAPYNRPGEPKVLQKVRLAEKPSAPVLAAAGCEVVDAPPRVLADAAVRVLGDASLAGQTGRVVFSEPSARVGASESSDSSDSNLLINSIPTNSSNPTNPTMPHPAPSGAKVATFAFGEAKDGWCEGFTTIPLPSLTGGIEAAVVLPDGERVPVPLDALLAARRKQFAGLDMEFKPWVFVGEKFPKAGFKDALLANVLSGFDYKIATRYFDADCKPVEKAERAGRYGAVVEVTAFGETKRRHFALYRVADGAALDMGYWFRDVNLRARFDGLPEGLGVDRRVWMEDPSGVIGGDLAFFLRFDVLEKEGFAAMLLAGLAELPEEVVAGRAPVRPQQRPFARMREFLFHLKRASGDDPDYFFITRTPKDYDKEPERRWPLVVYLHGSGGGADVESLMDGGPITQEWLHEDLPFILITPQCPVGEWWEPTAVASLLDKVCATMRVDEERIYLTGVSMGGYGAWDVVTTYPERFAAVMPVCGAGNIENVAWLKDVPIWAFHGAKDDAVPPDFTREAVKRLKELGNKNVHYTEYPEAGHDIMLDAYSDRDFWAWFLEQRKKSP